MDFAFEDVGRIESESFRVACEDPCCVISCALVNRVADYQNGVASIFQDPRHSLKCRHHVIVICLETTRLSLVFQMRADFEFAKCNRVMTKPEQAKTMVKVIVHRVAVRRRCDD
ncbi:hypothetical protein WT83_05665 [Burkholderia territorii]|uniref:Uncharacterized protein n=1 Tax=Burkholderia territorii TaxID=1503055 RepID=A0A108F1S0_9BURK|nr:hypothetical protein WT83_05665 [Burkholderia territorii]